jgi:outer membrane protein OmpA-like peptidoglycan-associated protein/LysM repeat protein/tetratricopeptide (TPR) repeat protein
MKNKIKFLPILVLIALQFNSYGQINKANRYFDLYRFTEAIPLYKKVIAKNKADITEATTRLADCYRLVNDPQDAKVWYTKVVENTGAAPISYFYLGQSLCQLKSYTEAKNTFEKYGQLVPDDPRGKQYAGFCDWAAKNKYAVSKLLEVKNARGLNTKWSDFSPVPYRDGIVFTSDRITSYKTDLTYKWTNNAYLDLYTSNPQYLGDFWSDMNQPKPLSFKYDEIYHDGPVIFSNDGKKVAISRTDRKKVHSTSKSKFKTHVVKIFYANMESGKNPKFIPFYLNNDDYSVAHPALSADGNIMIFSSNKPGGKGASDLYMVTMFNGSWSPAINLGNKINSLGNEVFPYLMNDSTLLFASDGHAGFGGLDIYISFKKDTTWTEPQNLMQPINSSFDDFGILLFNDLKSGFFSSNRPEGTGLDDIYAFRGLELGNIAKEVTKQDTMYVATISGYVKDKTSGLPIDQATVFLLNPQDGKVKILKTDPNGLYKTTVNRPAEYLVKAMQKNYIADCEPWDIAKIEPNKEMQAPRDLMLDKLDMNKSFVLKNIYYDFNKYFIRDDAKADLNKVIKIMQENPAIIAELSSHTDSRASFEYNNVLSQNRANSAVDYIVSNGGILPGRLLARGYGEYRLTNKCSDGVTCTEEQHQLNRRTEFKVIGMNSGSMQGQFDPTKFIANETLDIRTFPDFFFEPCDAEISQSPRDVSNGQYEVPIQQKKVVSIQQNNTPQKAPEYHIVKYGETVYGIAKMYGMPIERLVKLNNIKDYTIIPGQKLKLDANAVYTPENSEKPMSINQMGSTHVVVTGETLESISKKYNIPMEKLRILNKLQNNDVIVGQKLFLE